MMKIKTAPNTQIPIAKGAIVIIIPVGMMPLRVLVKATLWSFVKTDDLNGTVVCK